MLIAVDIGNTHVDIRLTDPANPLSESIDHRLVMPDNDGWPEPLGLPAAPAEWFVVSVQRQTEAALADWVKQKRPEDRFRVLGHRDLPIVISVEHPERVGMDRLAAAVAANQRRNAQRAAVIIDSGSAITVDAIDPQGRFVGGAIFPGPRMSAHALHRRTDLLPLVELEGPPPEPLGVSTPHAIRSGLFWGTLGAIRELAGRLAKALGPAPVDWFVTGGGAEWLSFLPEATIHVPNLVLEGVMLAATRVHERES